MASLLGARHRLNLGGIDRDDIEHPVADQADLASADLHDDHDMQRRRFGQAFAEAAAQVDDRNDGAAQIEHAATYSGCFGRCVMSVQPLISRTAMMSTPYWSSPMAKLMNWVGTFAAAGLFGFACRGAASGETDV